MPRFKGENTIDVATKKDLSELTHQEMLSIGLERIKTERGWKNKDLAAHLGVTEGYMSEVVRGKRDIKLTMLDKMTRELGVSIKDLFEVCQEEVKPAKQRSARRAKKKMTERHLSQGL
ncbi:helix-turn-helix transcriptional regulator (plasmid) [Agrobacterium leguminum]|uniref:helix-turn-helix domain-containing protein n=1 Tax=Agrobacterium leguminum TaxID=2792015 RepID=UPI0010C97991|nr:helix-turn-helix transcriptional regulator [Agrobacterium leguminum]WFS69593.1 helix-turn-helix transcriptional regulator [Agrobacterium leguminum]